MAVLSDKQFFFIAIVVAVGAAIVTYQVRKLGPAMRDSFRAAVGDAKTAVNDAKDTAGTVANAPLQAFRDPLADSGTFGTEAWVSQQFSDIQKWLGINQPVNDPTNAYAGNSADSGDVVPVFDQSGVIVPYFPGGVAQ